MQFTKNSVLIVALVGLVAWTSASPLTITWNNLKDVKYQKKFYAEVGEYFLYPTFGKFLRQLNGKPVSINGYVIPVDTEGNVYVVSKFPMAQCFFCGLAGPETIIMLNFKKKPRRMKTDEKRCFTGRLRLNSESIEELNFILEEVTFCE
jgi:hypothetical protein